MPPFFLSTIECKLHSACHYLTCILFSFIKYYRLLYIHLYSSGQWFSFTLSIHLISSVSCVTPPNSYTIVYAWYFVHVSLAFLHCQLTRVFGYPGFFHFTSPLVCSGTHCIHRETLLLLLLVQRDTFSLTRTGHKLHTCSVTQGEYKAIYRWGKVCSRQLQRLALFLSLSLSASTWVNASPLSALSTVHLSRRPSLVYIFCYLNLTQRTFFLCARVILLPADWNV